MITEIDGDGRVLTVMSEPHMLGLAAGAWVGALVAVPVPLAPTAVAAVLALVGRSRLLFIVAVIMMASQLGHRAEQAFQPVIAGPYVGLVTVVDEPERMGRGWRAPVRMGDGRRVEAIAFGPSGHRLSGLGAGFQVELDGRLKPKVDTSWARSRHLVGELAVADVGISHRPTGPRAAVEGVRNVITAGADALPVGQRALYTGLVVGEDRLQSDDQRARFRVAGLSHLLAVSGQNVAFVLAVTAIPGAYLGRRSRMLLTAAVLVTFAVATRLEPSVLRATAMAAISTWAVLTGRETGGLRALGLAVTILILIDPFLVLAIGFQLSVLASAAIVVLSPALARRLPGPEVITRSLAVTLAAQIGVAPLLVHHFDAVPMAALPANIAAGWAAGLVMVLGLTVGPVAGAMPGPIDAWFQLPVSGLLWWIDAVASWAVRLPLPVFDGRGLVAVVGLAIMMSTILHRFRTRPPQVLVRAAVSATVAMAAIVMVVLGPMVPRPPAEVAALEGGGRWFPGGDGLGVLVVEADADRRLLESVLANRISRIDVVVSTQGSGPAADVAAAVTRLTTTGRLLGPRLHRIKGAWRVDRKLTLATGSNSLLVEPVANDLRVSELP